MRDNKPRRVCVNDWITQRIGVSVDTTGQPNRVAGDVPPGVGVIVAPPVVVKPCLRIVILPREPQVEGRPLAGDAGLAEWVVARLPNYLAAGIGRYSRASLLYEERFLRYQKANYPFPNFLFQNNSAPQCNQG